MIPLIAGNPTTGPATSTRFVLPFAYEPEPWEAGDDRPGGLYYELQNFKDKGSWRWREDYFTPETADVLYRHARWAKLGGSASLGTFTVPGLNGPLTVAVAPAQLVLFEWPDRGSREDDRTGTEVLQIGLLILELFFPDTEHPPWLSDLLLINERFRYWGQPWDTHFEDSREIGYRRFLGGCPVNFLDPSDRIEGAAPPHAYFRRWAALLDLPVRDNGQSWRLFPREWAKRASRWVDNDRDREATEPHPAGWIAYADTRTFVWTCAVAKDGGNALRYRYGRPQPDASASSLPPWIQLLNVDAPRVTASGFEQEWTRSRTYVRWEEEGPFYGFAYHAAAMLGPPWTDPPLWRIFGSMYFDQTLLLLYLRVTTFRFSHELSRISSSALREGGDLVRFSEEFRGLRRLFALFTNLYEFPLLSQQQQAIEMYGLARKHMDVHELFEEIQEEIKSSHEFVDVRLQGIQADAAARQAEEAARQARQATRLTLAANRLGVIAAFGAGGALVTGFLGMSVLDPKAACALPSWLRSGWPRLDDGIVLTLCGFRRGSWLLFLLTTLLAIALIGVVAWKAVPIGRAWLQIFDREGEGAEQPGKRKESS